MSYLLDRKIKRKKILTGVFSALIFLALFYFRLGIWSGLSYISHVVFSPILTAGNIAGEKISDLKSFFLSKNSLLAENQNLQSKLSEDEARMSNYNSVLAENVSLKEILGRKNTKTPMIISVILSKPNRSPYDTLIIDAGAGEGIKARSMVFALGNIPIGRVAEVYPNSSKVVLFSNSGEKTQVVLPGKNTRPTTERSFGQVYLELVGRGGGNFEMIMPSGASLVKGDEVVFPGIAPHVVALVATTISDPRDSFLKALLVSPVNIVELKFVEVEN